MAQTSCDLPRNIHQAKNFRKSQATGKGKGAAVGKHDTLAEVMRRCKEEASDKQPFIRAVAGAPEPMCVMASEQQLQDMTRFCTDPDEFCVTTADPTFNLGPFDVTPLTYQNLLMRNKDGNPPVMLGPTLVHQTKTLRPFHFFASTLICLNPNIANLQAFGTDGESELIKGFKLAFPNAVHLRCFNHFRQNIKDKLQNIGIPQSLHKEVFADIFGNQSGKHFEEGLVDADTESLFWTSLKVLERKWNNIERSCLPEGITPTFYDWFYETEAPVIVQSMLKEVREKANLGNPPTPFTTNGSESINKVIKAQVDWKESNLPTLIEKLHGICEKQQKNIERAIIGRSEWQFASEYSHLQIPESKWYKMSQKARERHIRKVNATTVSPEVSTDGHTQQSSTAQASEPAEGSSHAILLQSRHIYTHLDVSVEASGIESISQHTLHAIWNKAEQLLSNSGHVLSVPWSKDPSARLVASFTSEVPHLVTMDQAVFKYMCDNSCPQYKGFSICSHTVAAAQDGRNLQQFLNWYVTMKCGANLTNIGNANLPQGAGRKGRKPKRQRVRSKGPIETRSKRLCLEQGEHTALSTQQGPITQPTVESHQSASLPTTAQHTVPRPQQSASLPTTAQHTVPRPQQSASLPTTAQRTVPRPQQSASLPTTAQRTVPRPQQSASLPTTAQRTVPRPQQSASLPTTAQRTVPRPQQSASLPTTAQHTVPRPQQSASLSTTRQHTVPRPQQSASLPTTAEHTIPQPQQSASLPTTRQHTVPRPQQSASLLTTRQHTVPRPQQSASLPTTAQHTIPQPQQSASLPTTRQHTVPRPQQSASLLTTRQHTVPRPQQSASLLTTRQHTVPRPQQSASLPTTAQHTIPQPQQSASLPTTRQHTVPRPQQSASLLTTRQPTIIRRHGTSQSLGVSSIQPTSIPLQGTSLLASKQPAAIPQQGSTPHSLGSMQPISTTQPQQGTSLSHLGAGVLVPTSVIQQDAHSSLIQGGQPTATIAQSLDLVQQQLLQILSQRLQPTALGLGLQQASPHDRPFTLKFLSKQTKLCQACRGQFHTEDTMPAVQLNLIVARLERRTISNPSTGVQFLSRESNSHYHLNLSCLCKASPAFSWDKLVIPPDIKLSEDQKDYLQTLGISAGV